MSIELSAESFKGSGLAIEMSVAALAHVRSFDEGVGSGKVLRIDVDVSGCSGYMYVMDFVDAPKEDDHCCQVADDVAVYVARGALPFLRGTRLDYVTEGLNSFIKFDNPNAKAHCGCGESFTVAGLDAVAAEDDGEAK